MPDTCNCTSDAYGPVCQYFRCIEQFDITVNTSDPTGQLWPEVYPGVGYVPDQNCAWKVTVDSGYFLEISLETYSIAKGDLVAIEDGLTTMRILETDADDSTIFIETKRNSILIRFTTDSVLNGTGFNLTYQAVPVPTGADSTISGYFETNGGPAGTYGNDANEQWVVGSPTGSVFLIDVQMGGGGIHASDLLTLTDPVLNQTMTTSGTDLAPASLTHWLTPSNSFIADFVSDTSLTSNGFKVTFQERATTFTGCSSVQSFTASSGSFSSENYPTSFYPNNLDCSWLVSLPVGQNVWFTLTVAILEPVNDFLTIYDGSDTNATILFQSSNSNFDIQLMSTGNSMLVTFHTNGPYRVGTGFHVSYRQAQLWPQLSYLGSQSVPDWEFIVTHGSTVVDGTTGNVLLVPNTDLSQGAMWTLAVAFPF